MCRLFNYRLFAPQNDVNDLFLGNKSNDLFLGNNSLNLLSITKFKFIIDNQHKLNDASLIHLIQNQHKYKKIYENLNNETLQKITNLTVILQSSPSYGIVFPTNK